MLPKEFGNKSIKKIDWAKISRADLSRELQREKVEFPKSSMSSGSGSDVAGSDKRSVHAYLAGKGDLRTVWWNLYSSVYQLVVVGSNLEDAMYSFHRFHHTLTLFKLNYLIEVKTTTEDLKRHGVIATVYKRAIAPAERR